MLQNKSIHSDQNLNKQKNLGFEKDPHSYSEPNKVRVSELNLELKPSFETRQISGIAELTLNWLDDNASDLVLDTKQLNIQKIEAQNKDETWSPVNFKIDKVDPILGAALHINASAENKKVRITYQTSPDANGLQWLEPNQTAGKKHPYVYSHSEPINARTWIPLQDTPAVRFTYKATLHTPKALRAVMSANNDPDHPLNGKFEFTMPQKIPSYLVAFAIGDIVSQKTGPRSAVYSEPKMVSATAREFEDTEKMIRTTEGLYGPYRWDNYDILVLPPSFPMGGMENPRLTFATPTIIAGDKSLVSIIAHELAHSWSGNLVTNNAWEHIWLNEGFTTYVENRIVEAIYGKEQADQEFIVAIDGLKEEMQTLQEPDHRLVPDLEGRDPHDGFSQVAYIKGAWFLKTLEEKFGRENFDNFLRQYFDHFAFQSNSTNKFKAFLQTHLVDCYPNKYSMEEINKWIHQPGIPNEATQIHSERLQQNDVIQKKWLEGKIQASDLKANEWCSNEWQYFIDHLPNKLTQEQMRELDDTYHLTGMGNSVVAARWYKVAIANDYTQAKPAIAEHLLNIGRRYLVVPLYEELLKTENGRHFAQEVYQKARPRYHSVTRDTIDKKFTNISLKILPNDNPSTVGVEDNSSTFRNGQAANLTHFKHPVKEKPVDSHSPDITHSMIAQKDKKRL